MKITVSKSQWEEMGIKAGWIKKASVGDEETEILDFSTNLHKSPTYSMRIARDGFEFEVEGDLEFEFEPAQNGGRINPSWPAGWAYLGNDITSFNCVSHPSDPNTGEPMQPTPVLISSVKMDVARHLDERGEDMANQHGSIMEDDAFEPPDRNDWL